MTQVDQNSFIYAALSNIAAHLGVIADTEDIPKIIEEAKSKVDELRGTIADLTKQNEKLTDDIKAFTDEIKDVTDQNASVSELYKKEAEKNSKTIQEGRKAIDALTQLRNYVYAMAAHLKLKSKNLTDREVVEKILDEVIEAKKGLGQVEKVNKFNSPAEPTVSQAIAAVSVKRKSVKQRLYEFLQIVHVLK